MLHLICKNGEGKSLVLLGLVYTLRGVTIVMGPLHGLGTDQANKSKCIDKGLKAYHVNEFRDLDYRLLVERLKVFKKDHNACILIYISPQIMREKDSRWHLLLKQLAINGLLSVLCIDEVHGAIEYADSFYPEFGVGINAIRALMDLSKQHHPHHPPCYYM